jgi:hypothetical protein
MPDRPCLVLHMQVRQGELLRSCSVLLKGGGERQDLLRPAHASEAE